MAYILPSIILSLLLNIPMFLELKHEMVEFPDKNNESHEIMQYMPTKLRLNLDYIIYYKHWIRFLTTGVVPFLYLSCMNILIFTRIRQNNKTRNNSKSTKRADNLATILIFIGFHEFCYFLSRSGNFC